MRSGLWSYPWAIIVGAPFILVGSPVEQDFGEPRIANLDNRTLHVVFI